MSICPSSAWDSFNSANESMSDKDMEIGNALAEAVNSALSDYQAGDICGFDLLCKITKAVDVAQDAVSALEK